MVVEIGPSVQEHATAHQPVPYRATKDAISQYAEEVAAFFDYKPGDPLEPVLTQMGGRIVFANPISFGTEIPDSILVREEGDFEIYLGSLTSQERDRFTIAHELGHYFVHYLLKGESKPAGSMRATRWIDDDDKEQQRAEWEANWFAASFLMPAAQFRSAVQDGLSTLQIAQRFGVSLSAAEVRKRSLGLA